MEAARTWLRRTQFSVRTLMLVVAAAGTCLAVGYQFARAPIFPPRTAEPLTIGLITLGIILPALWVGALRRLSPDALLAQIAGVCTLLIVLISVDGKRGPFFAFVACALGLFVVIPSMAWYVAARAESGDNLRRWTVGYAKNSLQLVFGFAFFMSCFLALTSLF